MLHPMLATEVEKAFPDFACLFYNHENQKHAFYLVNAQAPEPAIITYVTMPAGDVSIADQARRRAFRFSDTTDANAMWAALIVK